jgi:uncharacterized membrane protein
VAESNPRRLDQPKVRSRRLSLDVDPEAFGRFSERAARLMGTGKFLFWQTLIVIIWISFNLIAVSHAWDPFPFILLNLVFSTQAAYAAPLILLAQNRQDDRDRISLEDDRARAAQTKADTEFLARELAALRVAIGEVATRDYLRGEIDRLLDDVGEMTGTARPDDKRAKVSASSKGKGPSAAKAKSTKPRPDPGPAARKASTSDKILTAQPISDGTTADELDRPPEDGSVGHA